MVREFQRIGLAQELYFTSHQQYAPGLTELLQYYKQRDDVLAEITEASVEHWVARVIDAAKTYRCVQRMHVSAQGAAPVCEVIRP